MFDQLSTDQLAKISPLMTERRVDRREIIVRRGDTLCELGFLIEGRLQTVSFTLDGKEVGTDFIDSGDFFGELGVIDGQPAPEFVIAVAPSRVTSLDRTHARELMLSNASGAEAVVVRLAERLRLSATHKAMLALPSSFQRVCAQLASLARPVASSASMLIEVPPTHQEIAIMVNTSRETVTRTLQFLQSMKVVAREGADLVVLQPEALKQAVDGKLTPAK